MMVITHSYFVSPGCLGLHHRAITATEIHALYGRLAGVAKQIMSLSDSLQLIMYERAFQGSLIREKDVAAGACSGEITNTNVGSLLL